MRLDDVKGFVFDIDGTLVHREGPTLHLQPGAVDVLTKIRASDRPFVLFTNGSHLPPGAFADEIRRRPRRVPTTSCSPPLVSVLFYLRTHEHDGSVLAFVNDVVKDTAEAGVALAGDDAPDVGAVFVAHQDVVDFLKLERAARALLHGAPLLTGSYAPYYAGLDGPIFSRRNGRGSPGQGLGRRADRRRQAVPGRRRRRRRPAGRADRADRSDRRRRRMDVALGRMCGARTILVTCGTSVTSNASPFRTSTGRTWSSTGWPRFSTGSDGGYAPMTVRGMTSAEEAVSHVRSGDTIMVGGSACRRAADAHRRACEHSQATDLTVVRTTSASLAGGWESFSARAVSAVASRRSSRRTRRPWPPRNAGHIEATLNPQDVRGGDSRGRRRHRRLLHARRGGHAPRRGQGGTGHRRRAARPREPDLRDVSPSTRADELGNLWYRHTARNFNPMMATAAKITIAEAGEIVAVGELDPESIATPHLYVDQLVASA